MMNAFPCPFCGSERLENFDGGYLKCIDCQATGPTLPVQPGSSNVRRWNERRGPMIRMHWQRGLGHATWCGLTDPGAPPLGPLTLTLNLNAVSCVQCLRASNVWAAEQLKKLDAPERFSDRVISPPIAPATGNPRSGTSVQCGSLTLNIPPGHICSHDGETLTIRSPETKDGWTLVHVTDETEYAPVISFST